MRGLDPRICRWPKMAVSSTAMTALQYVMYGRPPFGKGFVDVVIFRIESGHVSGLCMRLR
jgi:hypothetical protein